MFNAVPGYVALSQVAVALSQAAIALSQVLS
jgi:hypothetical protein